MNKDDLLRKLASVFTMEETEELIRFIKEGSAPPVDTESKWWNDREQVEKLANSGMSPEKIEAFVKAAALQEEAKQVYDDYEAAGRIMAHGYWDELKKLAGLRIDTDEDDKKELLKKVILGE